jgi:hypothetical protein
MPVNWLDTSALSFNTLLLLERVQLSWFPSFVPETDLPFPDRFDVTMGGHVFGDHPEEEYRELARVTKVGGMVILCPGNDDRDDDRHRFLVERV